MESLLPLYLLSSVVQAEGPGIDRAKLLGEVGCYDNPLDYVKRANGSNAHNQDIPELDFEGKAYFADLARRLDSDEFEDLSDELARLLMDNLRSMKGTMEQPVAVGPEVGFISMPELHFRFPSDYFYRSEYATDPDKEWHRYISSSVHSASYTAYLGAETSPYKYCEVMAAEYVVGMKDEYQPRDLEVMSCMTKSGAWHSISWANYFYITPDVLSRVTETEGVDGESFEVASFSIIDGDDVLQIGFNINEIVHSNSSVTTIAGTRVQVRGEWPLSESRFEATRSVTSPNVKVLMEAMSAFNDEIPTTESESESDNHCLRFGDIPHISYVY